MEAHIEGQRICGATIEDYCFNTQRNYGTELTRREKIEIVENKVRHLNSTEWQRWTPLLGMYRTIRDIVKSENSLLVEMHSEMYNTWNMLYNVTSTIAIGSFLSSLLMN